MFGVFKFISKTCSFFIKKGNAPSIELTLALYMLLNTPEFESDLEYISENDPEKLLKFLSTLRASLSEMEKDK